MSREATRFGLRDATLSISLDHAYTESLVSLHAASKEASRPDWDGHGGQAVSNATIAQALTLLDLLPSALPRPEISPHPDGELGFEWWLGPRRVLTVSINETGRVSYAALLGPARSYGTEFLQDALPEPMVLALRRLYSLQ